MALKAYRHLTDGEVKVVESGSAEETALLADTVQGASYLQLTSAGHSQEVAADQGTALWAEVTSDLGGTVFDHLAEDTDNGQITCDWDIYVTPDPSDPWSTTYTSLQTEGKLEIQTAASLTPGVSIQRVGENYPRFGAWSDGSVNIGGGAANPDAKIRRAVVGGKIQLIATVGSTEVVLATEP